MKKTYQIPAIKVIQLGAYKQVLAGSPGKGVYTDDPQKPGNALGRYQNNLWDDEDDVDY